MSCCLRRVRKQNEVHSKTDSLNTVVLSHLKISQKFRPNRNLIGAHEEMLQL